MNPIKVLILTANPEIADHDPLRVDAEVRQIEEAIQRSRNRDRFQLVNKLAVRTTDLRRALLDHKPQIVHFSGHGTGEQGLVLENDAGKAQLVSTEALSSLFGIFEPNEIECVLLNACYSEIQAIAIHQYIDCVIGMNQPIGDKSAIQFAEGFYDALGAGTSYDKAYRVGCNAIALGGSSEYLKPVLKYRKRHSEILPGEQSSGQPTPADRGAAPPEPVRSPQSQTIGNITISGSNNPFNAIQAGGNVTVNQSQTQMNAADPVKQPLLQALDRLKRAIAATDALDDTDREMVAIPMQKLEAELQKSQSEQKVIEKAIAAIGKTLNGVGELEAPLAEVVALAAKG